MSFHWPTYLVACATLGLLIGIAVDVRDMREQLTRLEQPIVVTTTTPTPRPTPTRASRSNPRPRLYDVTAYTWTGHRTASGAWPHPGMAASNLWPLGTRLHVPGVGQVVVTDRVGCCTDLDLYLPTRAAATAFGRRHLSITELSS